MSVSGIIFSNIHDTNLPEFTRLRTLASIPFGCRYRLIDFTLSNMVNSNIINIDIITHYNYHSLMDHIGSGKDWDLARRSGGVKMLPPFISAYANNTNTLYRTRLEALKSVSDAINRITDDYVVLSDCDVICNIDLGKIVEDHIKSGADVTMAVQKRVLTRRMAAKNILTFSDESGRVRDIMAFPTDFAGEADVELNICVFGRKYLQEVVMDAIAHGYTSLTRDIFVKNLDRRNYRVYKYDGFFAQISSFLDYYACSMELVDDGGAMRAALFGPRERPIYTKVRNSAPTYYGEDSHCENSMIADGCSIEGRVENSVIFRGVRIGKGSVIKNSILFQDTYIGENASLNCIVTDKNVVVRDGVNLSGHYTMPFYVTKGKML